MYLNVDKNTSNFFLRPRDFKLLGIGAYSFTERNDLKVKGQDHFKIR